MRIQGLRGIRGNLESGREVTIELMKLISPRARLDAILYPS